VIERNNPAIDVDDLMSRIQHEVAKRGVGFEPTVYNGERSEERGFESIEALINTAQAKAEVRTQWSARFQVFPFNRLAWLQRFLLRVLAYVFKDQRHVNFAILQALRGVVKVNLDLTQRVTHLENEVRILESRIETLEFRL
jgi:O-antigen chain-terminating methyltransferase